MPTNIVAFERLDLGKYQVPVAFGDGSVESLPPDKVKEMVEAQTGKPIEELQAH
jgi:hypothetical protein